MVDEEEPTTAADEPPGATFQPESSPPPKASAGLSAALAQHHAAMEALEELLNVIAPQVAELDKPPFDSLPKEVKKLPPDRQKEVAAALNAVGEAFRAAGEGKRKEVEVSFSAGQGLEETHEVFSSVIQRILRPRPKRLDILLQSLVTTAVSAFEVVVSAVLNDYYRTHPGAMGASEKEFSLDDLNAFDSLDDATTVAIQRRVERLLFESFEEWSNEFDKRLKLPFESLCIDWTATRELFARRNLLIHNAGKVNQVYLARMGYQDKSIPVGTVLTVDEEYVRAAIDNLLTLGTLLIIGTWAKLHKDDVEEAGGKLSATNYALMLAGRWSVVERLCAFAAGLPVTEGLRLVFVFNELQARKRLHGLDAVKGELTKLDSTAMQEEFRVAHLSLLEDTESGIDRLLNLVATNRFSPKFAREWPIFEELRRESGFEEKLREAEAKAAILVKASQQEESPDDTNNPVEGDDQT